MLRALAILAIFTLLSACAAGGTGPLPEAQRNSVAIQADGPPRLSLITVINNRTGSGAHTALMVSGSQRVIFDPAGSYRYDRLTEHGDVLYGISDRQFHRYRSAHARSTFHVVTQSIEVPANVAEHALALVEARGQVSSAFCANATSGILRQLPGFDAIDVTFYPGRLMEQFAALPGVETDTYYENDAGDIVDGVAAAAAAAALD